MIIKVNRKQFLKAFEACSAVASRWSTSANQGRILCYESAGSLSLQASTGENSIDIDLGEAAEAVKVKPRDKMILDAAKVGAILKATTCETVEIGDDKKNVTIETDCGKFTLGSADPAEFAAVEIVPNGSIVLDRQEFINGLELTSFAVDADSSRYQLGGVYLALEDNVLAFVATDGRRLSRFIVSAQTSVRSVNGILPAKAVQIVSKAITDSSSEIVKLSLSTNSATMSAGPVCFSSRLVEGRYPNWQKVIPNYDDPIVAKINPAVLGQAIRQAAITTDKVTNAIEIEISGGDCSVRSNAADVGKSFVSIPVESTGPIKLNADHRFLTDWLSRIPPDADVELRFKSEKDPFVLEWSEAVYVVMPMSKN